MSNSGLVNYTRVSPNSNNPRNHKIDKITIHHVAGNLTVETLGNVFAPTSRQASSNYGVGSDGRIGMYVEEKNRAWTSGSPENDHRAITIEVSNNGGAPNWTVSDKALETTINLCADICKRNGIARLNYDGTANGNLTRHNMFQNTNCPGPYLQSKFPYIAEQVNKILGNETSTQPPVNNTAKDNIDKVAQDVIKGLYGNGEERKKNITNAGYDYNTVQSRVNELLGVQSGGGSTNTPSTDIDSVAKAVIRGDYGNGADRTNRLTSAFGASVAAQIQARVNQMLAGTTSATVNIDEVARQVIRGDFGNGTARKNALVAKYGATLANQIQARVNQLL